MANWRAFSREEHRWPSGQSRPAALFAITPEGLTARTGVPFWAGLDELDYFRAAAVELSSARRVLLIWHERSPVPGLALEIDFADDPAAARAEVMDALDLTPAEVLWMPEFEADAR